MKRGIEIGVVALLLLLPFGIKAQDTEDAVKIRIKTNVVAWATTTPNVGFEIPIDERFSFHTAITYNPFTLKDNNKLKHWLVQPEVRWWTALPFMGHFVGVHLIGGQFNAGGINMPFNILPDLDTHRYQGWGMGGGISYGYAWDLGKGWGIEASVGVGYARLSYDVYPCEKCAKKIGEDKKNYFGPTKAAINIVYTFK